MLRLDASTSTSTSVFYHITRQCHLKSIADAGLQPSFGGGSGGISALHGSTQFLENSAGKIHLTSSYPTAKRYVDHYFKLLEKRGCVSTDQCPAILKINLPSSVSLQDDPDETEFGFTLTTSIIPESIEVAMSPFDQESVYGLLDQHKTNVEGGVIYGLSEQDISYMKGDDITWISIYLLSHPAHSKMIPSYPD